MFLHVEMRRTPQKIEAVAFWHREITLCGDLQDLKKLTVIYALARLWFNSLGAPSKIDLFFLEEINKSLTCIKC